MSLVIVETTVEQPMTNAYLEEADQIALPCLQAHGVTWLHSLLSLDRHQMICTFDAPDAASVRNSYAKLGIQKRAIWAGKLIQPEATQPDPGVVKRYVVEAYYPVLSETDCNEVWQKITQCCTEFGVNWLRSYFSLDQTRVVYELDAPDVETIYQFGIPYERIWPAQLLMP